MTHATSNIENTKDGQFKATVETGDGGASSETFGTYAEAQQYIEEQTSTAEPAASDMTPEDAEEINSDVRIPGDPTDPTDPTEKQPSEELSDNGAGNREAPHSTDEKANDGNADGNS